MGKVRRASEPSEAYDLAVARLASIGEQLKSAEAFGAGPASDADRSSDQVLGAAAAGLEALAAVDSVGSAEAGRELVDRIRRELAEINGIVFR